MLIDLTQTDPIYFYNTALNSTDINKIIVNLTQAANLNYEPAIHLLLEKYSKGEDKNQVYTQELLDYYKVTANNDEYSWSQNYYGVLIVNNRINNPDKSHKYYFEKSAQKCNPYGIYNLHGTFDVMYIDPYIQQYPQYANGVILNFFGSKMKNTNDALEYYKMSLDKKFVLAIKNIERLSILFNKNINMIDIYTKGVQLNDTYSMIQLARLLIKSKPLLNDHIEQALQLYSNAIKNTDINNDIQSICNEVYTLCNKSKGTLNMYLNFINVLNELDMKYEMERLFNCLQSKKKYKLDKYLETLNNQNVIEIVI